MACFPTNFSSCLSAPLSQDFEPGQNPWCLTSGRNEAQALMSHCKNSVRDTAIGKIDGFVWIQTEAHSAGCGTLQRASAQPWNVVWLVFASWMSSYANEWEDHPNH